MTQSVEGSILGFGLGYGPRAVGSSTTQVSVLGMEPIWNSLSLFLSNKNKMKKRNQICKDLFQLTSDTMSYNKDLISPFTLTSGQIYCYEHQ